MATYDFQKEWNNKGEVLPYTEKPFLNKGEDFHFAIIADRGGSERKGFFGDTMKALKMGKHVLSEVTAFFTPAQGVALVEEVEKRGLVSNLSVWGEMYCSRQ